jgi:hypothetical protein
VRGLELEITKHRREKAELEKDARLWHEADADRKRRIGNVQWWQELDYHEGEKLALQAKLEAAEATLARLREALVDLVEDLKARWDMSDPRTNPGIRYYVQRADAALVGSSGGPPPQEEPAHE